MLERYQDKHLGRTWSLKGQYERWLLVTLTHLKVLLRDHPDLPYRSDLEVSVRALETLQRGGFTKGRCDRVLKLEAETLHDVDAFLRYLQDWVKTKASTSTCYLHLGLTSSDLTDTARALGLRQSVGYLLELGAETEAALSRLALKHKGTLCVTKTHGRLASVSTLHRELAKRYVGLRYSEERLRQSTQLLSGKASGPDGNHLVLGVRFEEALLKELGLGPAPPCTQVVPRWTQAPLLDALVGRLTALEQVALDVRLWSADPESGVWEGKAEQQTGSSSLPHKSNPLRAEKVCGLAPLGRGYRQSLAEVEALWGQRDLTHSCVDRVALVDLLHTVAEAEKTLTSCLKRLVVDVEKVESGTKDPRVHSFRVKSLFQELGLDRVEAARETQNLLAQAEVKEVGDLEYLTCCRLQDLRQEGRVKHSDEELEETLDRFLNWRGWLTGGPQ